MRDRNNQMFMPYDNNGFFPYNGKKTRAKN